MDSAISIQPITNSQFLSVCNYITSFGLFLNNLGIIKTDEGHQTMPVLNALFEHLNEFENQSKTKIQSLQALFHETDRHHSGKNKTLIDMKIAEGHHRYVIYNDDQYSLIKGSSKLTLLAIERILVDYILPIFIETWTARGNLSGGQKEDFQQFRRSKRNPSENSDEDALTNDESNDPPNKVEDLSKIYDKVQHLDNNSFKNKLLTFLKKRMETKENPNIPSQVQHLDDNSTKKKLLTFLKRKKETKENSNIPPKVRKVESKDSESKSEISDEVQHLDDNSTKNKLLTFLKKRMGTEAFEYNNFFMSLMSVKENGLSVLRNDEETYKKFTLQIKALADQQRKEEWMKEPVELWLRKPAKKFKQFQYLANLKEKAFNFNDITLLTKKNPGYLPYQLFRPISSGIEMSVLYHVTSDTQYGFVDLGRFDANFTDLFITFPYVKFTVTNTTTLAEKDRRTTILHLKRNPVTKQGWYNNGNEDTGSVNEAGRSKSVSNSGEFEDDNIPSTSKKALEIMERNKAEKNGNERMQAILKAADFISSAACKPMQGDFIESLHMLKSYILEFESKLKSDSYRFKEPTYHMLAEKYCEHKLEVPAAYSILWKIINAKYVDDVLFENKLYSPENINALKNYTYHLDLDYTSHLVDDYLSYRRNLSTLQKTIRFEDFFQIREAIRRKDFIPDNSQIKTKNAIFAALYRLGLKQCDEKWGPITLYCTKMYSKSYIPRLKPLQTFSAFQRCSLFPNLNVRDLLNKPLFRSFKFVLFKIEFEDPDCGIVDMGHVTPNERLSHTFIVDMTFTVNGTENVEIDNQEVVVKKLLPKKRNFSKGERMISFVHELIQIFSSGTKFYIDEN